MSFLPGRGESHDPLDWFRLDATPEKAAASQRDIRRNRVLIGLGIVALIFLAWAINPPVGSNHAFTKDSDYKAARGSGCTNSGKGCHGAEKTYADFNAYHKDLPCTGCHDYQGIGCIPCHTPGSVGECQLCHDGSIEGVSDRVRIVDPYPRGHYRETSHTALGTDFLAEVRAAKGGKAKAACGACHARDLKRAHLYVPVVKDSPYGNEIDCVECHDDQRSDGQAQVLAKWKKQRCQDCHTPESSSPTHDLKVANAVEGSGTLGCGSTGEGCHPVNDLHVMHADEPKDCSGSAKDGGRICHDLQLQSAEPTTTSCGGGAATACHRGYVNDRYGHRRDRELHSPTTFVPAGDTSYHGVPCGRCHRMDPDGTSLVEEHGISTSERSETPGDNCRNCHGHLASAGAIADDWKARDTFRACPACHGVDGLPEAHLFDLVGSHLAPDSVGCASSGPGCHPTNDLSQVGVPTPRANLHSTCLRCHDWRRSGGNLSYDPRKKTCGAGRDCHGGSGAYVPRTGIHAGAGGRADGRDGAHHRAGTRQAHAAWDDPIAQVPTACDACHSMTLGTEHARPNNAMATGSGTSCARCHNRSIPIAGVVKASWPSRDSGSACAACHTKAAAGAIHSRIASAHAGGELDASGTVTPGACARSGCHATAELRRLHRFTGCTTAGCHAATGDIDVTRKATCGGPDPNAACHAGYSAAQHFVDHDADRTGTVLGVTYHLTENKACFGCHFTDLRSEHSTAVIAGSMEGGGASPCAVCHAIPDDPGRGAYSGLAAVQNAIAAHDVRCVACHTSGSAFDGPLAAASAHKARSGAEVLPAGRVWSDPLDDWRAALDAPAGGGHNVLDGTLAGAGADPSFPVTSYAFGGTTFTWALPPNTGPTTWLRASVFGTATVSSEAGIRSIRITCDDCHVVADAMAGPHGASVKVNIDPAYSQTNYANPPALASQFTATGTQRVVCFKCHTIGAGSVPGSPDPGGHPAHALHAEHPLYPAYNPVRWGEKCVDCHARIPHAWKHQRLLVRTAVTTDGVTPDAFPYVRTGHDGLAGVRLRDISTPGDLARDSCVTGGCFGSHAPGDHPMASDVPAAALWP